MTVGKRITYGKSPRQYVEVYPGSGQVESDTHSPLLIYCHGGGWYSGSTSDHEDLAKYISTHSNVAVALLEYRITLKDEEKNEIRHPDHINDIHRGLELLFDPATSANYKYDTSRVVFAGHSVGGWVVLSAALASDQGQGKIDNSIHDMPQLDASIRKSICTFIAVVSHSSFFYSGSRKSKLIVTVLGEHLFCHWSSQALSFLFIFYLSCLFLFKIASFYTLHFVRKGRNRIMAYC